MVDHVVKVFNLGVAPFEVGTLVFSSVPTDIITISDTGSETDTLHDSVVGLGAITDPDGRDTQIVTGSIGGVDFTGTPIYSTVRYVANGSDGSSFEIALIQVNRFGVGDEIATNDGWWVSESNFVSGVTYNFTPLNPDSNFIGQRPYEGLVVCFTSGTFIRTPLGDCPIEDLVAGDLVETADRGAQEIRWIGKRTIGKAALMAQPELRPVRIQAGALGCGLPERDLLVSPQHRMMVSNKLTLRMFDEKEVLVAAKQLVALDGIDIASDVDEVTYVHFLCDQHEVVFAEGAASETLYTGAEALKSVGDIALAEIFSIFPELRDREPRDMPAGARHLVKGRTGRRMAQRLSNNSKMPLELV